MEYMGTAMADALSVKEIFTVLRPDLVKGYPGRGEAHPFPEIIYLSKGHHTLLIDRKEYTLTEGQMIIYAPASYHEASLIKPVLAEAAILTFEAESEFLPTLYNKVITLTPNQKAAISSIVDEGITYFCGRDVSDPISGMVLREGVSPSELWGLKKHIELFLIDVYKTYSTSLTKSSKDIKWDEEFSEAVTFLQTNISSHLTLEEIAVSCSMSVSKLKLLFRQKAGMGAIDYLNALRIERAKQLMDDGKLNFTQISEELGFSSLHYFSRTFKKSTGMSPSEYTKNK